MYRTDGFVVPQGKKTVFTINIFSSAWHACGAGRDGLTLAMIDGVCFKAERSPGPISKGSGALVRNVF
jgi:hypothetical protein